MRKGRVPASLPPSMGRTAPVMNPACSEHSHRIAARTLQCRGDYRAAAASTVILARALLADLANSAVRPGVYDPEELLGFDPLAPAPARAGHHRGRPTGDRQRSRAHPDTCGSRPMRRPHRLLLIACATVLVLAVGGLSAFALAGRSPRTVAVRLSGTGTHVVPVALVDTPRGFAVQPNRIMLDPGQSRRLDLGRVTRDVSADFRAAVSALWSGEVEAESAACPPWDGGGGREVGAAK